MMILLAVVVLVCLGADQLLLRQLRKDDNVDISSNLGWRIIEVVIVLVIFSVLAGVKMGLLLPTIS